MAMPKILYECLVTISWTVSIELRHWQRFMFQISSTKLESFVHDETPHLALSGQCAQMWWQTGNNENKGVYLAVYFALACFCISSWPCCIFGFLFSSSHSLKNNNNCKYDNPPLDRVCDCAKVCKRGQTRPFK